MEIRTSRSGPDVRPVIDREVDFDTSRRIEVAVQELIARPPIANRTVDLGRVTFLNSASLRSLIAAKRSVPSFRLLPGNPLIDRRITLTGLQVLYGEPHGGGRAS